MLIEPDTAAILPRLVARIRSTLPTVCGVWLFGSRARGQARAESDFDLAVLGEETFDSVALFDLALLLGIDARQDVDLVDLRVAPVVLKKEIVAGGVLVACFDAATCEEYAARAMELYVAFRDELAIAKQGTGGRR